MSPLSAEVAVNTSLPPSSPVPPQGFTYAIETLGCKANLTDSNLLSSRLNELGGLRVDGEEPVDVYVLNSCTVTDRADRDALKLIAGRKAGLRVLTGCMAEVSPDALDKMRAQGQRVLLARNSAKAELANVIRAGLDGVVLPSEAIVGDRSRWHQSLDFVPGAESLAGNRTRAFLKVQDGCNQFCSYCIIPLARGRSRSLTPEDVVREVADLANQGIQEVVLTAIHAADYASSIGGFTNLVERVLTETRVPRLRLTSLDPAEIDDKLLDLMSSESRLCPHFHVSLQSGSTRVLAAMKRHYDGELAEERLHAIVNRVPGVFIGMDMIAGFPGESDVDHEETVARLKRSPWTRLHVFPYSLRRSTVAAKMVAEGLGVPEPIKRIRAKELRALSEERLAKELDARVGRVMELLVEEKTTLHNGIPHSQGHSRSYFKVIVPTQVQPNSRVTVRIEGAIAKREVLLGALLTS